jgi:hypothetical protein
MEAAPQEDVPGPGLDEVLEIVAGEIELAGARCLFLDSLIGDLMREPSADSHARLHEGLQTVDLLSQHLAGLSTFVRQLSIDTPSGLPAPVSVALGEVTLGALADRLTTSFGWEGGDIDDRADAGDVDLF